MILDTNVILRHLLQDHAGHSADATRLFASAPRLLLVDLIAAEALYVMQSFYSRPRSEIAQALRSLIALPNVVTPSEPALLRALDLFADQRMDFPDAYLVALAESSPGTSVATFDKGVRQVGTVAVIDPARWSPP
ncbi:MAG: PIN domain-containing protein [Promicromonosporaceae bacterium]|nr:PIN domain-containing protein [Promicromonosporaceae bacterium]